MIAEIEYAVVRGPIEAPSLGAVHAMRIILSLGGAFGKFVPRSMILLEVEVRDMDMTTVADVDAALRWLDGSSMISRKVQVATKMEVAMNVAKDVRSETEVAEQGFVVSVMVKYFVPADTPAEAKAKVLEIDFDRPGMDVAMVDYDYDVEEEIEEDDEDDEEEDEEEEIL